MQASDAGAAITALSPSSENNYLVYPLPQKATPSYSPPAHAPPQGTHIAPTSGEVLIYDATKLEAINVIEAHQSPLSCIALNNEGTLLATASEKGTIIRIFSVPKGDKLYQFRRGTIPARIYSMSFNATSPLLCVSSASETVHVFRLVGPGRASSSRSPSEPSSPTTTTGSEHKRTGSRDRSTSPPSEDHFFGASTYGDSSSAIDGGNTIPGERKALNPTFASMIRRTSQSVGMGIAARVGGYLPKGVTEMWEPQRDFAWVKIPRGPGAGSAGPVRTVVAMSGSTPRLMVVSSEGWMFVFNLDLEKGGEGIMEGQYSCVLPIHPWTTPGHSSGWGINRISQIVRVGRALAGT
jgi:autophagy-related protein 18